MVKRRWRPVMQLAYLTEISLQVDKHQVAVRAAGLLLNKY